MGAATSALYIVAWVVTGWIALRKWKAAGSKGGEVETLKERIKVLERRLENPNICENCAPELGVTFPEMSLADTGICGNCGECDEVFDPLVVEVYRDYDTPPFEAWLRGGRLRSPHMEHSAQDALPISSFTKRLYEADIGSGDILFKARECGACKRET